MTTKPIALYAVTINRAPMMAETGTFYSFHARSFGPDKRHFDGDTTGPVRVVTLAPDVTVDWVCGYDGESVTVSRPPRDREYINLDPDDGRIRVRIEEIINDTNGYIINPAWGTTSPYTEGAPVITLDELVATLEEEHA